MLQYIVLQKRYPRNEFEFSLVFLTLSLLLLIADVFNQQHHSPFIAPLRPRAVKPRNLVFCLAREGFVPATSSTILQWTYARTCVRVHTYTLQWLHYLGKRRSKVPYPDKSYSSYASAVVYSCSSVESFRSHFECRCPARRSGRRQDFGFGERESPRSLMIGTREVGWGQ